MAVWNDHRACIEFIIEEGADVNYKDHDDNTPLSYALANDYKNAYELLMQYGANDKVRYSKEGNETVKDVAIDKWGGDYYEQMIKVRDCAF